MPSLVWPLLPVILGPAIAVPLALGTSGEWVGRLALATRLWRLPEETVPPECLLPLRLSAHSALGVAFVPPRAFFEPDLEKAEA